MSITVPTPLKPVIEGFTQNAITLLHKRYLWHGPQYQRDTDHYCVDCTRRATEEGVEEDIQDQWHETIDEFFDRISMGNPEYRELMTSRKFLPNSPTMFNIGTGMGTLSACFKFDVQDSMQDIMAVAHKSAMVQKFGGGVGYYVGNLRAKNAPIKTTHGKACGPVEVLRMYNQVAELITQGGKRRGAQMGILDVDHPDIREFIHMKDDIPRWEALATRLEKEGDLDLAATLRSQSEGMQTFNISVAITDEFMSHVNEEGSPQRELMMEMALSSWTSGDPGVYFVDTAEASNPTPWVGKLTGTNPCGEVCLIDNEPCNLGSVNLGLFTEEVGIDETELGRVVRIVIRYLDDVLDQNEFPDPAITAAALATRKLGLGVMGWADALAIMEIPYGSSEAVSLGETIMALINETAVQESEKLGTQRGAYGAWADAPTAVHKERKLRRNATVTCIAPTGSISLIAGCSSGIEPHFAHKWSREMGDGTMFQEEIPILKQLEERGSTFIPEIATEIDSDWHVAHLAAFQRQTELAVSKTVNMASDATPEMIADVWYDMWNSGCKGGTVYRTGSREKEVLVATPLKTGGIVPKVTINVDQDPSEMASKIMAEIDLKTVGAKPSLNDLRSEEGLAPISLNGDSPLPSPRKTLDDTHESITHKFTVGGQKGWIHAGLYHDGTVGEVFLDIAKQGSTVSGLADILAICISIGLQHGIPVEEFINKFRQTRFEPSGMTSNEKIKFATSFIDYLGSWLESTFVKAPVLEKINNGSTCPDCGNGLAFQGGCETCTSCGWSRCG